jgi:hypothetical protein
MTKMELDNGGKIMNKYNAYKFNLGLRNNGLKKCSHCSEIKLLEYFYKNKSRSDGLSHYCRACVTECNRKHGIRPLAMAIGSGSYLGVHVAERVLSSVLQDVEWMPINNPGYDCVCSLGNKIDVKSACLRQNKSSPCWEFTIRRNKVPNYFALLAFDNITDLNPMHLWLVPGEVINDKTSITITNTPRILAKWENYEYPIYNVIDACDKIKLMDSYDAQPVATA